MGAWYAVEVPALNGVAVLPVSLVGTEGDNDGSYCWGKFCIGLGTGSRLHCTLKSQFPLLPTLLKKSKPAEISEAVGNGSEGAVKDVSNGAGPGSYV